MNLDAARVFVRDLAEAHRFYADALGLPVEAGSPDAGYLVFGGGSIRLVVEPVPSEASEEDQALVGRFTGLSFRVRDIRATHATLTARGVLFTGKPELQPWGGTLATLQDPAGNELQLVEYPGGF